MAKYNPFAEKAGMRKIAEQPPPKEALKIAEILSRLGFNIQLLGNEKYVLSRLRSLSTAEINAIREALARHGHGRLIKHFFAGMPFGRKKVYAEEVMKVDFERLAHLIKTCGFLLQTKVYLFWKKNIST